MTDNDNTKQFSEALTMLGKQAEVINLYGQKANTRFHEKFDIEQMSKSYSNCYGE